MAKYYIGFDCGTQSAKTALYRDDMVCMAKTQIATNLKCPKPEWLEMDVNDYLSGVIEGIKYCVETSGIDPKDIRAICGDGVICGIVGVDEDLNPITPYINYLDSRTKEDAKWLNENVEDIWATESGNAYVDSFYPPLFARWFLKNVDGFRENGAKLLNNGPYVLAKLAGL
ncbi:MAG: FGGY family carbohydrate kinase, partial [Intestinibacter sp.]